MSIIYKPGNVSPDRYAYLVGCIETNSPYRMIRVDIYGSNALNSTHMSSECYVDILQATGKTYEEACNNLISIITATPMFRWIVDLLPERLQREITIKDIIT